MGVTRVKPPASQGFLSAGAVSLKTKKILGFLSTGLKIVMKEKY